MEAADLPDCFSPGYTGDTSGRQGHGGQRKLLSGKTKDIQDRGKMKNMSPASWATTPDFLWLRRFEKSIKEEGKKCETERPVLLPPICLGVVKEPVRFYSFIGRAGYLCQPSSAKDFSCIS